MGRLIDGVWKDQWYDTEKTKGRFERESANFRNWLSADSGSEFKAESNRYHLYVSLACPWAHRTLIFRKLKGLENLIPISIVSPYMLENGWEFKKDFPETTGDQLYKLKFLHQIYTKAKQDYSGRVTVPVLWDTKTQTIVSNESADIIRMFNKEFNHITGNELDFYPKALQKDIDEINAKIYQQVNNGVYRCGFATTQAAYDEAITPLFDCLDELELRLKTQGGAYLFGDTLTEADWRLFTTLIRFDCVYVGHFKCNLRRICDYEHLSNYLKKLYYFKNVKETVNFQHIKAHYYYSHHTINPYRIMPKGPVLDL